MKSLDNIKNNLEIKFKSVLQIVQNQKMDEIVKAPLFDFKLPTENTGSSLFSFLATPNINNPKPD